jgi:hypothetical protein
MEGMMNKWQIGPVKLANGEDAFIDAINEEQDHYRYTGRMPLQGTLIAVGWDTNGRLMYASSDNPGNLAPPPKKTVRVQRWLNIDADGTVSLYELRSEADTHCFSDRIACVEIDREVTEGEGL